MAGEPDWREGIALFQAEAWFEAHEVLERLWRGLERGSEAHRLVQGVIQLAVGLEHLRRGNPRGARGQWQKAEAKLAGLPEVCAGLRLGALRAGIAGVEAAVGLEAAAERQGRGEPPGLPRFTPPTPAWV